MQQESPLALLQRHQSSAMLTERWQDCHHQLELWRQLQELLRQLVPEGPLDVQLATPWQTPHCHGPPEHSLILSEPSTLNFIQYNLKMI